MRSLKAKEEEGENAEQEESIKRGNNLSTIKWFIFSLPLYYQYLYVDLPYKLDLLNWIVCVDPNFIPVV